MTEVPKIVHHRLGAADLGTEGAHPGADVLAALAEKSLSAAERESVLSHLAVCGDCRNVVVLALPAEPVTAPLEHQLDASRRLVSVGPRWNWFAWGNLRWAALTAGIVVAVLLLRPGLERWARPNPPANTVGGKTAQMIAPTAPTAQAVAAPVLERELAAEARPARTKQQSFANKPNAGPSPWPSRGVEQGVPITGNLRKDSTLGARRAPAAALEYVAPANVTEAVGVSGAAPAVPAPSADENLEAQVEAPPIEKAKPATDDQQKAVAAGAMLQAQSESHNAMFAARAAVPMMKTVAPAARWMLKAGVLQRSLDSGQSWQTMTHADHALLCYADRGREVWTGGEAGTLLHSTDFGTTWSTVEASFNDQSLNSDVTRIEVRADTAEIVLTTASHETWTSPDGGKTWQKK